MKNAGLSFNSRKALMVNIGESAGTEIANLIAQMAAEIEELRRTKVNVTKIVPSGPDSHEHLVEEVLFQNSLSVIVRGDHPLTQRTDLTFANLADEAWVIARGSATIRQLVANEFRFEGSDPPKFAVETDSMLCVKGLLLSGDFVSANPPELFATEIERGVLSELPIRWHSGARSIGFILREHGTITPAMASLIEILRDLGRERVG